MTSVAGVTVSYEPQELDVSLQIPLNSEGKISHSWTIRVNYEVRRQKTFVLSIA